MPKVYIEREAANEFFCQTCDTSEGTFCVRCDGNPLKSIPAADVVERKKGKWIRPVPGDGEPYCSECKAEAPLSCGRFLHHWYTNFCPNCGAKMEG